MGFCKTEKKEIRTMKKIEINVSNKLYKSLEILATVQQVEANQMLEQIINSIEFQNSVNDLVKMANMLYNSQKGGL